MPFLAHTGPSASGKPEPLRTHLQDVGRRAGEFAGPFEAAGEAWIAGLLHDLGKYGDLFQRRLQGKEHGIDHWSVGAWVAFETYRTQGIAAALAIQGHHIGLQQASKDSLSLLNPASLSQRHPLGLRLSSRDLDPLVQRFKDSKLALPGSPHTHCVGGNRTSSLPGLLGAVPVKIQEALSKFSVLVLRLIVQPRAALKLPAQNKGNTLRGAFGTAFRRLVCPDVKARKLQVR